MKYLPTLYSRTSTGAVQEWKIMVEDNRFRVEAGQQNGAKVLSEWTECESKNVGKKNETTSNEQALSEAQSKWDKKMKTGYTTDVKKIDSCVPYVEPMLAKSFDDYATKLNYKSGLMVQNKYNGVRCVATFEGNQVVLKSRKGEPWLSVVHINNDLQKFFEKYPDAVLDGELYNYDLRQKLNEMTSIVRKTKNITTETLKKSQDMVLFYIYDGFGFGLGLDEENSYSDRKKWIDSNLPKWSKYYRKVETKIVTSKEELDVLYNGYLKDGEEGAIIRDPKSSYERKRSKNLLKYKPEDSSEAVIEKLIEGEGNWSGTAKTATLNWNGKTFDATFRGTYEQGQERLKNKKDWVGMQVTFLYTGLTGLGIPNYARIDPDNCISPDR